MKKKFHSVRDDFRSILMWLFYILMGVQIVLGTGWILANIVHLPLFQETAQGIKASESLAVDEYMGILYPLLIRFLKWISGAIRIPYYTLLYVGQLFMAGYAAVYMIKHSGWIGEEAGVSKIKMFFSAGYLLTFPLLLQMHMAVLPYSLAMSISVILICDSIQYLRHWEKICGSVLIRLCGFWLLTVLLVPDYSWLLGIFMVGVMVGILWKNKKWRMRILVSILSTVLCFGVIGNTTQTPGSMGRIQKTFSASLLSRFVWPHFASYSLFWPDEIADTFSFEELSDIARYSEGTVYDFGYVMDEKYGREAANDIYLEMALTALGLDTKRIFMEISSDLGAYLCPQVAFQIQEKNNQGALLAWNYGRLQERAPLMTKYYVNCSFAGWNVMCVLGLWRMLLQRKHIRITYGKLFLGISMLFMALWYTMQGAGMQDYKKVMLISFLWLLPVVKAFCRWGSKERK